MATTLVVEETIETVKCQFYVDGTGTFFCDLKLGEEYSSTRITADSLKACRGKVLIKLRKAAVNVEVKAHLLELKDYSHRGRDTERVEVTPIVITGKHATHSRLLITKDGKRDTLSISSGWGERLLRFLTPTEIEEVRTLHAAKVKAVRDWDRFLEERQLDGEEALKDAYARQGIEAGE